MDSPQPSKSISTAASGVSANAVASSDSPVQESPFSSFLSNLSPINPVKPSHVPQGFLGLSSPPLIFTSPRATLHQRTSFLQRLQLSNISSLETPEKDDERKNSDDLREPETYCRNLINDIQEDNNIKNNEQDQHVGCADEYLNYAEDFINSAKLIDPDVKQSNDALQSSISSLSNASSHEKSHAMAELDTSLVLFEPIKEDPPGKSFNENKPTYIEEEQIDSIHPHESDLSVDRDPGINQCDIGTQENEEYVENMKTALQGSIQNVVQCDLELTRGVEGSKWCTFWKLRELRGHFESSEKQKVSQLQRGLSRRCLQFEEAGRKNYVRSIPSSNQRDSTLGSGSLASATDMESSNPPHVDLTASSNKKKMLNLSQLANSAYLPRSTRKSHTIVPKPSGIGLHLNSIALPTATSSHSSVVIIKSTPTMNSHHVENKGHSKKLPQLVDKAAIAPEDNMSEPLSSLAISAVNSEPCQTAKPLNKRNLNLENADNFEEFSQLSPTKKRRKTSMSADAGGCKRCNCKKTKCLKLYCDCFAAGIYCSEGCACQGCFNKPEYEATVMETRQLIESRNPLAFAPKVVQRVSEHTPIIKEDGSRTAPSLARHKKGCNCKKSMCLKKYCECYQANVGCSSECRCEGCRNSYGRKEEYHSGEETLVNRVCKERYGVRDEHNLEMVTTKGLQAELHDTHSLTPSTPSFQHTDHGKDAAKYQLNPGRYLPSPESDFSNLPSHTRPIKSPSNDMIPQGNEEILDIDSFEQGMDYNVSEIMDQFSPGCNELSAICNLTPSQNSSTAANLAPSALSKTKESLGSSRFQLCSQSGHLSSGRSLRWRSSPITPMPELGETKNRKNDCDGGNFDILGDDTPEILKEDFTPIVSVKATSPNKKRVSPPHNHVRGLRPSSSVGLKSGRKFILTAISSSSSLTPCSQSSGQIDDKSSNN